MPHGMHCACLSKISDLMVHARINDLKGEIENAIAQVRSVRERLLRLA